MLIYLAIEEKVVTDDPIPEHAQLLNASDDGVHEVLQIIFSTDKTGVDASSAMSCCQTHIERDAAGVMIRR